MEFITEDFIKDNGLAPEQVEAITNHFTTEVVPSLKKEYDGLANKNAEGILDGASKYAKEVLGLEFDREQGEKAGDFLKRAIDAKFGSTQAELEQKGKDLDAKLKNFKGSDEIKQALEAERLKNDTLLQQVAELEPLKGLDVKYEESMQTLSKLKREVAYGGVKPNFPETVNKFEADAKWKSFVDGIEEKYNIEIVDGKAKAIDKENIHKVYDLATLVGQDENIAELLKGRQQGGTGANPINMQEVEGVPFKVPTNATGEEITNLVREHVLSQLGSLTHKDFANQFQALYNKVKTAKK